jgi:light-regulated signal transduction histidine kinase (bacteriophytochrome)
VGKDIAFINIDCNEVVKHVIVNLGEMVTENNAKIIYSQLPRLKGSEVELKRIFRNLIGNAIKFRKKDVDPVVEIKVKETEEEFVFAVIDNGVGIEAKYFKKLFVIFQRLESSTDYPGTGIGLATCKKIATLHKGRIWVESKVNKGSVFYFTVSKKL